MSSTDSMATRFRCKLEVLIQQPIHVDRGGLGLGVTHARSKPLEAGPAAPTRRPDFLVTIQMRQALRVNTRQ